MTAAMASEQPAPRFRWHAGNDTRRPVDGGTLMTAAEVVDYFEHLDGVQVQPRAWVAPGRVDCVVVDRTGNGRTTRYHGVSPAALPGASEPDARRRFVKVRADYARDLERAQRRIAETPRVKHADRRELAILTAVVDRLDAELAALASPSRSETAVEANR